MAHPRLSHTSSLATLVLPEKWQKTWRTLCSAFVSNDAPMRERPAASGNEELPVLSPEPAAPSVPLPHSTGRPPRVCSELTTQVQDRWPLCPFVLRGGSLRQRQLREAVQASWAPPKQGKSCASTSMRRSSSAPDMDIHVSKERDESDAFPCFPTDSRHPVRGHAARWRPNVSRVRDNHHIAPR